MDASESSNPERGGKRREGPSDEHCGAWYRRQWTTIVLEADDSGWRATQTGVDVEGRGETAADAAADYCRLVAETGARDQQGDRSGRGDLNG